MADTANGNGSKQLLGGLSASSLPLGVIGFFVIFGSVIAAMWMLPFPTRQEITAHNAQVELEIAGLDQRLGRIETAQTQGNLVASDTREKVVTLTAKFEDFKTFIQIQNAPKGDKR